MPVSPDTRKQIERICPVSRETLDRLETYVCAVQKWSRAINLVAGTELDLLWERHVLDCLQLVPLRAIGGTRWGDLGSGGGFPGVVAAIALREHEPEMRVALVESDRRKAAFLSLTTRDLDLNVVVHSRRAEALEPLLGQTISARALAPLERLLPLVSRHVAEGGVALLPKGRLHEREIVDARRHWAFTVDLIPSIVAAQSRILRVTELRRSDGA